MRFTVLGSAGFIGRHMATHLMHRGYEVLMPARETASLHGAKLGHVIYAIGLTGNFRQQPRATIEAHVNVLQRLLEDAEFDSWLYLSSTRVYSGLSECAEATEFGPIPVTPGADAVYDLSKLLGEAICLGNSRRNVRVARLANVYGVGQSQHTFLGSIVRDVIHSGTAWIGEAPSSSKDYIALDDAIALLEQIATDGREQIYNVASGKPVTHAALANVIRTCGYNIEFAENGPVRSFPTIDVSRIAKEFGRRMHTVTEDLPSIIKHEKEINLERGYI